MKQIGRVELKEAAVAGATWGYLCAYGTAWTLKVGHLVCRQVGFDHAHHIYGRNLFGKAEVPVKMLAPSCGDADARFRDCTPNEITGDLNRFCDRSNYASVYCV